MKTSDPQSLAATATRIAAGDDRTRYDSVAITLHWLTAILVLAQFALSQTWGFFDKPVRHVLVATHMSFGVILSIVIVARIIWRLMPGHQVDPANVGWMDVAANAVHYVLYVLLGGEAVLGFLLRWSEGQALNFFGLLIPAPFAALPRETHHLIGEAHELVGWTIVVLATAHALAALFHQYVLRDGLLLRMLPARDA